MTKSSATDVPAFVLMCWFQCLLMFIASIHIDKIWVPVRKIMVLVFFPLALKASTSVDRLRHALNFVQRPSQ